MLINQRTKRKNAIVGLKANARSPVNATKVVSFIRLMCTRKIKSCDIMDLQKENLRKDTMRTNPPLKISPATTQHCPHISGN